MWDFIQKFLSDHGAVLMGLIVLNAVLSGVVVALAKLNGVLGHLPWIGKAVVILQKVVDFLTANLPHKDPAPAKVEEKQ